MQLFDEILKIPGIKYGSHYSDLHVEATEEVRNLVKTHFKDLYKESFFNTDTKTWWYDFPMQYDPYWKAVLRNPESVIGD